MKRLNLILLLLAFAFSAGAQSLSRISLTIVVTNRAVTSNTLVVNASTRTWTNSSSSTTIWTNLVSTATTATNLYNNIAAFPYTGGIFPQWLSETSMVLRAPIGAALSGSQSGNWAILTLSTQVGLQTFTALWPIENIVTASNRTNEASSLVGGMSQFSTNAFATNSTANSNFITKGASPQQFISSSLQIGGTLRVAGAIALTNGFTSATTNINPVASNLVNYGNAIRSEGTGGNSLQVGSNALALSANTLAVGNGAVATNTESTAVGINSAATNKAVAVGANAKGSAGSTAIGYAASALGSSATAVGGATANFDFTTAIGQGAVAEAGSTAVGANALAQGTNNFAMGFGASTSSSVRDAGAIGDGASSTHSNAIVIGALAASSAANQIRLGSVGQNVSVPGLLGPELGLTNHITVGTNRFNARMDFTARANSSLANGNNSGIILGSNVYVRLSGPSAAYTNAGFAAEVDGSYHILEFDNPAANMSILNDSGLDATPANRITTGTGALVNFTNQPVIIQVIYNATAPRWRLIRVLP